MPAISLVVCLYRERDLLARLLRETAGLYDDLVVVHDGPETQGKVQLAMPSEITEKPPPIDYSNLRSDAMPTGYSIPANPPMAGSIHELVTQHGGRYFEGPRCFQQEPHWPFAWSKAKHNWILRLDADEYPSQELKDWVRDFKGGPEPSAEISGFTCIWPVWNGKEAVTKQWPYGRNFLFNRRRVTFFGVVEHTPVPEGRYEHLSLVLRHEPLRKSHGLRNILVRKQGGHWRKVIADSLAGEITDLPRWRLNKNEWPTFWHRLRRHPIRAGAYFLARNTALTMVTQWRSEGKIMPLIAVATPLHHFLVGLKLCRLQKQRMDQHQTKSYAKS